MWWYVLPQPRPLDPRNRALASRPLWLPVPPLQRVCSLQCKARQQQPTLGPRICVALTSSLHETSTAGQPRTCACARSSADECSTWGSEPLTQLQHKRGREQGQPAAWGRWKRGLGSASNLFGDTSVATAVCRPLLVPPRRASRRPAAVPSLPSGPPADVHRTPLQSELPLPVSALHPPEQAVHRNLDAQLGQQPLRLGARVGRRPAAHILKPGHIT